MSRALVRLGADDLMLSTADDAGTPAGYLGVKRGTEASLLGTGAPWSTG